MGSVFDFYIGGGWGNDDMSDDYPVEASIGYPTPGSFGTYAGIERQIPTITLELDETCPVEDLIKPVHEIFDMLCK